MQLRFLELCVAFHTEVVRRVCLSPADRSSLISPHTPPPWLLSRCDIDVTLSTVKLHELHVCPRVVALNFVYCSVKNLKHLALTKSPRSTGPGRLSRGDWTCRSPGLC